VLGRVRVEHLAHNEELAHAALSGSATR
jgi:hypothetical protein